MRHAHGFSLIEVLIALAVLTVGVTALAQLATIATRANVSAREMTMAALLAEAKMEQLRGLAWGLDASGTPISDLTADIAAAPNAATGGVGLTASPADALVHSRAGYCDFIDSQGRSLGGGEAPPSAAVYIRRWSIQSMPALPDGTLILQVRVARARGSGGADAAINSSRVPDEAWLVEIKTRKAS